MTRFVKYLGLALLALPLPAAAATLVGDSVTATYYFPDTSTPRGTLTTTVASGSEALCPSDAGPLCGILLGTYSLDFSADQIDFSQTLSADNFYNPATFSGWVFTDLDFGSGITGVTLVSNGIAGLDDSRLSFTSNSITLNLQGLTVSALNGWSLRLSDVPTVPVPAAGWLLLAGMGGLGLMRRRR